MAEKKDSNTLPPALSSIDDDSEDEDLRLEEDDEEVLELLRVAEEERMHIIDETNVYMAAATVAASFASKKRHRQYHRFRRRRQRRRQKAEILLQESVDDGLFEREFRMKPESFYLLADLLSDELKCKNMKRTRKDFVEPKSKLMMTLRWLAGGSYIDQCRIYGIGKSTFYKCVWQVIQAINKHNEIGCPKWPETKKECDEYATEWAELSGPSGEHGLFTTAIGMLDGILIATRTPSQKETNCADDYRSGHKKRTGINCQAMCDAKLRFMYVSVMCPGKTHDLNAYERSNLSKLVERLPGGYFCGGDNAYANTEHLIVPIPGQDLPVDKDAFNFYLSQLRIRIECAFGLLVARWGILWRPLRGSFKKWPSIVKALCKLHNFCIDQREGKPPSTGPGGLACPTTAAVTETTAPSGEQIRLLVDRSEWQTNYVFQRRIDGPNLRQLLVDLIASKNYVRPRENWIRNAGG